MHFRKQTIYNLDPVRKQCMGPNKTIGFGVKIPSMYIPLVLPIPMSSTWCHIGQNVFGEDDAILR